MAIDQKMRSLFCGLPTGIPFKEINGESVLLLKDVPFELENLMGTWLRAMPTSSASDLLHSHNGVPDGLTLYGCNAFTAWMLDVLTQAQAQADFQDRATALLHTNDF